MNFPEILAPVGAYEQLEAALRSGADAVYFGASSFNARRNAENFTDEDFIGAVRLCRERGVKAYITLNTVIKDSEREEFLRTVELIAKSGADAVILQDMGAIRLVKKCCPDIPLHASTQMAVHNVSGARLLEKLGFSRVVLARELSFAEIKKITESVNIETEVFVHGAHCMSVSGMCYMSSFIGARSGNRGLCAQPCRLNFRTDKREYALSLKDMCLADEIRQLKSAGVASLKIEGRMKRPEYVSAAVRAYKSALMGEKPDIMLLQSVFSRSGFTKGYFEGKRDLSMFGYRTKEDVLSMNEVLSPLSNYYRNENPLVEVSMKFILRKNENALLSISDGKNTVEVSGNVPEIAQKAPLSEESVKKSLLKLGSTFYFCENITAFIDDGLMLRASDINAMRREAVERLTVKRGEKTPYDFIAPEKELPLRKERREELKLRLSFIKASSMPENLRADRILLPLQEIIENPVLIGKYSHNLTVIIPSLIYPGSEGKILSQLKDLKEKGVKYALCNNIGAVVLGKLAGLELSGGALLNVINSEACKMYSALGVRDITLSNEISCSCADNINSSVIRGINAYGYLPLMHFRACPLQSEKGCTGCKGEGVLTDRKNEKFRVLCRNKVYSELYNTVPMYLGDKKLPDIDFVTLNFTFENKEEVSEIIDAFKKKKALAGRKTAGLYEREII